MTLEEFKDVNKNKTPLEKLQLMQQQHYYWRRDARHSVEAKLCGNQKSADFYARETEAMRERIEWLQSELEAALKLHAPTIDAIPVEYIKDEAGKYEYSGCIESAIVIEGLISSWRKEQEVR